MAPKAAPSLWCAAAAALFLYSVPMPRYLPLFWGERSSATIWHCPSRSLHVDATGRRPHVMTLLRLLICLPCPSLLELLFHRK
jgi:hypothetical protein